MRSLTLALCLVASVSLAQQPEPRPPQVQKIDFEVGEIEAGRATPIGELYAIPPRAKFASLIRVRMNFDDKLRESVHER